MWRCLVLACCACGRINFGLGSADARVADASRDTTADAPTGLLVWFPMDSGFDDAISGTAGTCSATQCPQPTTGIRGAAYVFDGVDDCIVVPDVGQLSPAQLTISLWLRHAAAPSASGASFFAKEVGPMALQMNSWQLEDYPGGYLSFTTNHGGGGNVQLGSPAGAITFGPWHHVAATWDGAMRRQYVNGALVAMDSQPTPLAYDTDAALIGCDNGQTSEFFAGALDDIRLYDRPLSDAEIAALAVP